MLIGGVEWRKFCHRLVKEGELLQKNQSTSVMGLFALERDLDAACMNGAHGPRGTLLWTMYLCIGSLLRQFNHDAKLSQEDAQRFHRQFGEALEHVGREAQHPATPEQAVDLQIALLEAYRGIRVELADIRQQRR